MPHQARLTFAIGSGASNISWINVKFGDWVPKGFMLAKLDTTSFDRAIELAEDDLQLAQLALDAAISFEEKEGRQILLDWAQIALEEAEAQRNGATMRAPFDGVITEVGALVGDYVTAGTTIFCLVDTSQTEAIAMIDEVDVNKVAAGQMASVTLDAISGVVINGYVEAISPQATIEAGVVTYKASIEIEPDSSIVLRDGMTAVIDIVVQNKENVLIVPSSAIKGQGSNHVVEVVTGEGTTEDRVVGIGVSDAINTEILTGLQEGEHVVVRGR
jgi:RND family efflux transporter MFP subunit